jgi:hypothetical protein
MGIFTKFRLSLQIFKKVLNTKYSGNSSSGSRSDTCRQTNGRTWRNNRPFSRLCERAEKCVVALIALYLLAEYRGPVATFLVHISTLVTFFLRIIYEGNAQGYVGEAIDMAVQSFMLIIPPWLWHSTGRDLLLLPVCHGDVIHYTLSRRGWKLSLE